MPSQNDYNNVPLLTEIVENNVPVSERIFGDGFQFSPTSFQSFESENVLIKNVHITNCSFDKGNDCIAIKSGRDNDGRSVGIASENIVVENCIMKDGHGGVVIGSKISGGVRNVYVRNCEMNSPNLERVIRIKTNTRRGGTIENIFVKNIRVGQVKEAVLKINTHYSIYYK